MLPRTLAWTVAAVLLVVPLIAQAQDAGVFSASGNASLERMPEIMRLKIDIPAVGADMKQAISKLTQKREAAVKKLKEMGVAEAAIHLDPPRMAAKASQDSSDADSDDEKTVKAHLLQTLRVEWPLKAGPAEALLETAGALENKVRKADLAGRKGEDASEEEEEKPRNTRQVVQIPGYPQPPKPGEPQFTFAFKVSDAERSKLLKDAFTQATAEAKMLAAAAGLQLGALARLSSNLLPVSDDDEWSPYTISYRAFQASQGGANANPDKEATGNSAKQLVYRLNVSVSYKIK